jgi:hypothetical protein
MPMGKKVTQKDKVLYYLERKGSITALEAVQAYCILDLASIIRTLIKEGFKIEKCWEKSARKHWIRYSLIKEAPNEKIAA